MTLGTVKFSRKLSACVNVFSKYGYESELNPSPFWKLRSESSHFRSTTNVCPSCNSPIKTTKTRKCSVFGWWTLQKCKKACKKISFAGDKVYPTSREIGQKTQLLLPQKVLVFKRRHNALWSMESTKSNSVMRSIRWSAQNTLMLSSSVFCVLNVWDLDKGSASVKRIESEAKMDSADIIIDSRMSNKNKSKPHNETSGNSETPNNPHAVLIKITCRGSLQTVSNTLSSGTTSVETLAICNTGSTFFLADKGIRDQLNIQWKELALNFAGNNGTKKMASKNFRINGKATKLSKIFHLDPSMCLGNNLQGYYYSKRD